MRRVILIGLAVVVLAVGALPAIAELGGGSFLPGAQDKGKNHQAKSDKGAQHAKKGDAGKGTQANEGTNGTTANEGTTADQSGSAQAVYPVKVCKKKKPHHHKRKKGKKHKHVHKKKKKKCKTVFVNIP